MQLPKMQNALWQKKGSNLLFKTRANQLSKNIMHIQEKNEVAPKRPNSLANAKQQVYFENVEVLVHKFHHQILCTIMQSSKNKQKHIIPRCYSTIPQQIQSSAPRKHCCTQIPVAIPSHAGT